MPCRFGRCIEDTNSGLRTAGDTLPVRFGKRKVGLGEGGLVQPVRWRKSVVHGEWADAGHFLGRWGWLLWEAT